MRAALATACMSARGVCLTSMHPMQRIEAPVRGESSADQTYGYGGKPVSERQSDVDRLLVDQNQPEEQSFLGTAVAFPDALRFKGAAPEVVNSRYFVNCIAQSLVLATIVLCFQCKFALMLF